MPKGKRAPPDPVDDGKGLALKIDLPFEEAVQAALEIKPPLKPRRTSSNRDRSPVSPAEEEGVAPGRASGET